MPTVHRLSNAKIQVIAGDHNPPHFRLIGPRSRCDVALRTFEVLVGHCDRRDLDEALEWARLNEHG